MEIWGESQRGSLENLKRNEASELVGTSTLRLPQADPLSDGVFQPSRDARDIEVTHRLTQPLPPLPAVTTEQSQK